MSVTISTTNKPLNPRAQDLSPKGYNRASLYSGKALDFDGVNDSVNLDGFTLSGTTATISLYINIDAAGSYKYIFDINPTRWVFGYGASSTYLQILVSGSWYDLFIPVVGEWYKIDLSINGTNLDVYANGVLVNTLTMPASISWASATDVVLAASYDVAGGWFNGQIAGFKIFNTALTAAQVSDLYLNPEKIVPDGVANSALKLWLPMMEGAGTTAYDGSGNGNHGTINGATWVSGVGAPVAQTALVGWNKGVNLLTSSEEFLDADWISQSSVTLTSGQDAPDGSTNAFKYNLSAAVSRAIDQTYSFGIASYTFAIYVKAIVDTTIRIRSYDGWSEDISINVADGWTRIDSTHTTSASSLANIGFFDASGSTGDRFYIWGASLEQASIAGPYVRTGATAQTSPVLLPQGLTASKDITGVNSVSRNAYALNLDGASWAEVHDNASLDFGSGSWSMECWVDWNATLLSDGIMSRWYSSERAPLIYATSGNGLRVYTGRTSGTADAFVDASSISVGWHHIVANYDSSDTKLRIYIDGNLNATSAAISSAYASNSKSLEIGRLNDDIGGASNTEIALPRIYNRALTATEISRNYNADKSKFGL